MTDARLILGRCEDVLPTLPAGSVDAVVCDPPAAISFMGQAWDSFGGRANPNAARDRAAARGRGPVDDRNPHGKNTQPFGYSGSAYPKGRDQRDAFVSFLTGVMAECLRVVKPGAYALVWALPRTAHWTATAVEDAGWCVTEKIYHLFSQGFPKHKSKLKPACEEWICAKKELNAVLDLNTIAESTFLLECLLWYLSPARLVETCSRSTPPGGGRGSVRWGAAVLSTVESIGPSDVTAMFSSPEAGSIFLSIASSWNSILDAVSTGGNTFTTRTASSLTTGLKTLNSWLSATIPESITRAASPQNGLWSGASGAGGSLSGTSVGWGGIPKPSVPRDATWSTAGAILRSLVRIAVESSLPLRVTGESSVPRLVPPGSTPPDEWPESSASASGAGEPLRSTSAEGPSTAGGSAWPPPTESAELILAWKPARRATPLNVDECRIGLREPRPLSRRATTGRGMGYHGSGPQEVVDGGAGRYPANLVLSHVGPDADGEGGCRRVGTKRVRGITGGTRGCGHVYGGGAGLTANPGEVPVKHYAGPDGFEEVEAWECVESCPIRMLDEVSGVLTTNPGTIRTPNDRGMFVPAQVGHVVSQGDSGGASRFFYCSKAGRSERWFYCRDCAAAFGPDERARHLHGHLTAEGKEDWSHLAGHPTQKPESLVRWLVKLISRPGDLILDPFLGSGTTALACRAEGRGCVGIEQDGQYLEIARKRLAGADGPLFAQKRTNEKDDPARKT